jgi:hypothetical protein
MLELVDPREERACQLRAGGKTQRDAYNAAFKVPQESKANNSSRFFKRLEIRTRVDAIKRRRATLADLDDAFVLRQLKAIAGNGEALGEYIAEIVKKRPDDAQGFQGAIVKLRAINGVVQANELLGKWLGMWKDKVGRTNPTGAGPPVIEVFWRGSPEETPPEPNGPVLTAAPPQRGP